MAQIDDLRPERAALLIMDVQSGIVGRFGPEDTAYLSRLARLADAARAAGAKVIYVIVSFRAGYPEISGRNLGFSALKDSGMLIDDQVHPAVAPKPGEVVVTKKRVSAFTGSDLEVVLRGADIDHLILTGIATSGVVLSTLRQASDADYRLTVVEDGCLDPDPEVHAVLTAKVFPRQAAVVTAEALIEALGAAKA